MTFWTILLYSFKLEVKKNQVKMKITLYLSMWFLSISLPKRNWQFNKGTETKSEYKLQLIPLNQIKIRYKHLKYQFFIGWSWRKKNTSNLNTHTHKHNKHLSDKSFTFALVSMWAMKRVVHKFWEKIFQGPQKISNPTKTSNAVKTTISVYLNAFI